MKAEHDVSEARRELVQLRRVLTSDFEVWKYFQYQFTVINQRTQTVFGLGGLAITVTGFSGQRIVASSFLSGLSLVVGLVCVLAALVIAISGSGNSRNVLKAVDYANANGGRTFGICGYGGGELKKACGKSLSLESMDMQKVEDAHVVLIHCVMQYLRDRAAE